jgi:E3 ubiquitin-protein ligase SIAH1
METADQSSKKPRLEPPPHIPVKQEVDVHEGTAGAVVVVPASESDPRVEGAIKMDMALLHCPLCSRRLKPHVFQVGFPFFFRPFIDSLICDMRVRFAQCKAGHLACGGCIVAGVECRRCEPGGGGVFDVRNTAMDAVVSAARVECPHGGCGTHIAYHELDDHRGACPHAPCQCTEPGCGFVGLPPALAAHLASEHAWPTLTIQYGKVYRLRVPVPSRRVLVGAGDDGGGAFVLTAGALGAATAVSLVCVRASAAPSPRYMCKMWANLPASAANVKADVALVEMKVESSTSPGAVVAVDELASFLTVPPRYLVPAAVAAAASMVVPLSIRIDRISFSL